MNFLKALFGGKTESPEEKNEQEQRKKFEVLKYDGMKALRMGQNDYAVQCFTHALELSDDLEVHDCLSQAYTRSGNLLAAFDELRMLSDAQPDNPQIFIRMADVSYMLEDYTAMGDACEKALLIDKDNPVVHLLYARACKGHGDVVNAVAMLTKAIVLKPGFGDALLMRGQLLLDMGDVDGAEEDADHLQELFPEQEDALLLKARVELKRGRDQAAIGVYDKVIAVNPFCVQAFRERGAVRLKNGDKDGAEQDMRTVLEIDPEQGADINGEYSAEGIEHKVRNTYRALDPLNLFPH